MCIHHRHHQSRALICLERNGVTFFRIETRIYVVIIVIRSLISGQTFTTFAFPVITSFFFNDETTILLNML